MQGKLTSTFTPNQNDVLAGRGCGSQLYPGNVTFRHSVKKRKQQYALLKGNKQKNELAVAVYQEIQTLDPPGRFLSKSSDGSWTVQDEKAVMVKIKQALRERSAPRPKSPIHNGKSMGSSLDIDMVANRLTFNKQDYELVGSLTITKHYSDFRAFLISDSLYLMSFASDDDDQDYIKRFLAGAYLSFTWKEFAQMCNYHYEESEVEAFLKAIWQLYPFLGNAYYFDSRCRPDSSSNDIKMFRTMETKR
jgi:hypothetical protein